MMKIIRFFATPSAVQINGSNRLIRCSRTFSTNRINESKNQSNNNESAITFISSSSNENSDKVRNVTRRRNARLESVKSAGLESLEKSVSDMLRKVGKRRLLVEDEDTQPSVRQLREAQRLKNLLEQAVEDYSSGAGGDRSQIFSIQGQPIVIMEVEVSKDLRQARAYWSLPFSLLLNRKIPQHILDKVRDKMQIILDNRGGRLQALVHTKLRSYYPPKIRFVPAEDQLLRQDLLNL